MRVRPADTLAELRAWYRLYLDTMRRHVVPPRPWRLFQSVWDEMRPQGTMRLLLAERRGEVLGGCVMLQLTSTVFYAFNGVRSDALEHRPNDAIHWEAIHTACAEGFLRYDLGEVVERHAGLARFKAKWGRPATAAASLLLPGAGAATRDGGPRSGITRAGGGHGLGDTCRCESQRSPATSPTVFSRSRQHGSPDRPCGDRAGRPRHADLGFTHVQAGASIGRDCNIGSHCYVESGAVLADCVTVKNGNAIWAGVTLDDGVFVGPASCSRTTVTRALRASGLRGHATTTSRPG